MARYTEVLRGIARRYAWSRSVDVPDRTLAVGPAENLLPLPGPRLMVRRPGPDPAKLHGPATQEGYEGFPGRGPMVPPEPELIGQPDYGPGLAGP